MDGGFGPGVVLLGKYRVESVLGRGGMGIVLRVTHLQLGGDLALKILSPETAHDPEMVARFIREAQSAGQLRGEHAARVSDVGMLSEGAPYIAMEYLRGVDLANELARRRALAPGEIVDYVLQACEALAEAHALGIVHRDLKPSNLFLTRRPDGSPLVKVLDFGISKMPATGPNALTTTTAVMGTPGYMSPEQMKASKDVDARGDIWALGIVLYECLNGRRPFDADSYSAVVLRAATEPPPAMEPHVPPGLQAVVLRCLEKDRAARFPSIAELAAALAPFARDARAAAIVVERTAGMLRGPAIAGAPTERLAAVAAPLSPTTQSSSAGMMQPRSASRRYALGAAAAAGEIAVLIIGALTRSESPGTVAISRDGVVLESGGVKTRLEDPSAIAEPSGLGSDAAAPAIDAGDDARGDDVRTKTLSCAQLSVDRKWQELQRCASELAALGDSTAADEFRDKAIQESASSLTASKVARALKGGSLRDAQAQLRQLRTDSVYFVTTSDAFRAAEARAVDDNRRKAMAAAAVHDCAAVKRLRAELAADSTPAVARAVAAIADQCGPRTATPAPSPPAPSPARPVDPPATVAAAANPCERMNVEDVAAQAQNQYAAGFEKAALQLVTRALQCRPSTQLYRQAALYACAARDLVAAKAHLAKIPPGQARAAIESKCEQTGLALRGP